MQSLVRPNRPSGVDPFEPIPAGESVESSWADWEALLAAQSTPTVRMQLAEEVAALLPERPAAIHRSA